jgi:hypothetical protein
MKPVLAFLIGVSLLFLGMTAYSKPPAYLDAVKPLVWQDENDHQTYPHCTTFNINSEKHYWLTAAHCIDDYSLDIAMIENHITKVVKIDQDKDLAILFSNVQSPDLQLSSYSPKWGQEIHSVGFMNGDSFQTVFWGKIANPLANPGGWRPYVIVGMTGGGGSSGGPFLTTDDKVISVMEAGFGGGFGTTIHEISGGVPYDVVRDFTSGFWRGQ